MGPRNRITANEARALSKQPLYDALQPIYSSIQTAAAEGHSKIRVTYIGPDQIAPGLYTDQSPLVRQAWSELSKDGYAVVVLPGTPMLEISWVGLNTT